MEFDGSYLHVRANNVIERNRFGTDDLLVPAAEIASVTIKSPRLMADGHLDVFTCGGGVYQLHFTRRQRPSFVSLHRRLLDAVDHVSRCRPAQSSAGGRPGGVQAGPARSSTARVGREPWLLHTVGWFRQDVAGESHHSDQLEKIAGPEAAGEKRLMAELRREPRNPHDRDAIRVLLDGQLVGYVPRADAPAYQEELKEVESWGRSAQCPARLWWRREQQELVACVSLDLAEPGSIVPLVRAPEGELVVPAGRWFQVTGEDKHMDVLVPLLERAYFPGRAFAYARLDLVDRAGPRSVTPIVVVRIGDGVVGELSRQTSEKMRRLLGPLRDARADCYAEAELTGNSLAAEVRVSLTMPEELPPDFVQSVTAKLGQS
ncbi:HIRAN domain-containing protein [Kitasatospora sp. NPDC088346]|uniref:HIRAN domain-containing protein n=1 Tax=Kitasatospora sp. NPDC088346 TaxID=3364073 RepID=UPI0037FB90DC